MAQANTGKNQKCTRGRFVIENKCLYLTTFGYLGSQGDQADQADKGLKDETKTGSLKT